MPHVPSPKLTGALLNARYAIQRKLGSGSMGTVYVARDLREDRLVALKVIRTDRVEADSVLRLQQEFRAMVSLSHPQIATVYDFGYVDGGGFPYYTSEYIQGVPLPAGPPHGVDPRKYLRPVLDLLSALRYLHAHGVLHLDIHAGNVIVADDERRGGVLIDFGLLHSLDETHLPLTSASWTALPPELVWRGKVTLESDLFLVARLLLYRLTGRSEGDARLPREIPGWGPRLTLELERIVRKGLERTPAERFASADAFHEALMGALGRTLAPRSRGSRRPEPPQREVMEVVGRDVEIGKIDEVLDDFGPGRRRILWFVARSGMGKTRLLAEARVRSQLRGWEAVDVSFSDVAPETLLARRLRLGDPKGRGRAAWLAPLDLRHGGSPRERAQRAAEAFFREDGSPLVLLLDDIDLARDESQHLLEALVAEVLDHHDAETGGRGLCLLMTSSKDLEGPVWRKARRGRRCPLRPLGSTFAAELLGTLLRPLTAGADLKRRALELSAGSPRCLRQVASHLEREWGPGGLLPDTAELPAWLPSDTEGTVLDWKHLLPEDQEILVTLAALRRAARRAEIVAAVGCEAADVAPSLRRLVEDGVVSASGRGAGRFYRLTQLELAEDILRRVTPAAVRGIHERLLVFLRSEERPHPLDPEHMTRHLWALGRKREARRLALEEARALARRVSPDRAIRLLEEVSRGERHQPRRLRLAQEMSRLLQETGDHEKGISLLEPFYSSLGDSVSTGEAVRVRRLLGTHYHRAGRSDEAKAVFEDAQRLADRDRDLEDLIFMDSELAELHIFRASFEEAEEACRRGLERIARCRQGQSFHGRMEVVLRASLGHLKLRKLAVDEARKELVRALTLSRKHGTTSQTAAILANLGIVENQRNEFVAARTYFTRAEDLLRKIGDHRTLVQVSTNLAVLAAKLGDAEEAHFHVERAARGTRHYPGLRLEFSVAYSRGIVHHHFGEIEKCVAAFDEALPMGRKLGDKYLVGFGEVYLADAHLAAGRYGEAQKLLRSTGRQAEKEGPPLLRRMVHSRLLVVETLMGRARKAMASRKLLDEIPRAPVVLLEAWNDLFLALACVLRGEEEGLEFAGRAEAVCRRLNMPAGTAFVAALRHLSALVTRDESSLDRLRARPRPAAVPAHAFLAVAMPLLRAEALFGAGNTEEAEKELGIASGAIIGSPFLELDWRIELLRSRLALRRGARLEARHHLHRCLHTRDHLLQLVPGRLRKAFLAHPRFSILTEVASRLEGSGRLHVSTERLRRAGAYHGMVGASSEMLRVFQIVERVGAEELPALIRGETGTGKELVARALHERGLRRDRPFLALHCAALPVELFESELFGYEAGAFTEAHEDRSGILESIDGGTLLLDEIGQLPLVAQGKLLQFLDSGAFRRVGGTRLWRADVRVLASTSSDLDEGLRDGSFRQELYYRLRGVEIVLPPLRDRKGDIALLARHFAEKHAERLERSPPSLTRDAIRLLERYRWPGNVRELETVLLRAFIEISPDVPIDARDVEKHLEKRGKQEPASLFDGNLFRAHGLSTLRDALEKEYLTDLYLRCRGDPEKMMEALGVKRSRLYAMFRGLGIDVRELRRRLET